MQKARTRLFSCLLALCLVLSLFSTTAFATESDPDAPQCTQNESCEAAEHLEGCPKANAPEGSEDPTEPGDNNQNSPEDEPVQPTAAETLAERIAALPAPADIDPENEAQIEEIYNQISEIRAFAAENGLDVESNETLNAVIAAAWPAETLADAVAKAGTEEYATLKDAFEQAPNGSEIVLLDNISGFKTEDIATVPAGKTLTLNMNGKSITVDDSFEGRPIVNNGTLTVTGDGTIDSSDSESGGYGAINNFGTLTIENGTFRGNVMADGAAVYVRPGGEATIYGGLFEGTAAINSAGKLTVYGGTFQTTSCNQTKGDDGKTHWAYCVISGGELYFYGGSVTGVQGGLAINNGYAEVKGGNFQTVACEHSSIGAYSFYALYIAGEEGKVEAHISGGTYTSASKVAVLCGNDNTGGDGGINAKATAYITGGTFIGGGADKQALQAGVNTGDPQITGGTFSSDVSAYVPDGNTAVYDDATGTYSIGIADNAVAEVDGIGYMTVQEAVNAIAASAGKAGTVVMRKDSMEDVTIPADVEITLSIPENVTLTNAGGHTITNNGTLTITGSGTVDNVIHAKAAVYNNGTVVLSGCTFSRSQESSTSATSNGGNSFYVLLNHGTMTIQDGTTVMFSESNSGSYSSMIENGYQNYNSGKESTGYVAGTNQANPSLSINGGTFTGGLNTVKNDDGGVLAITGGTFTNTAQAAVLNWNDATISGGTFTVSTNYCVVMNGKDTSNTTAGGEVLNQGKLTITAGSFTAPEGVEVIGKYSNSTDMSSVTVSGGTFSNAIPEAYCAEGYHPTDKDANGNYTVCGHKNVSSVPAVPAGCETDGNSAYWYCPDCGRYFSDEALSEEVTKDSTVIPATGHTYGDTYHSNADGHWHECDCGEKADSAAHTFEWVIDKEATATENGSKHEACTVCGYAKAAVEIPATGTATPEPTATPSAAPTTEPTTEPTATPAATPTAAPTAAPTEQPTVNSPQTGDTTDMTLWICLGLASVSGIAALVWFKRKSYTKH